jgi:hypothetical protein
MNIRGKPNEVKVLKIRTEHCDDTLVQISVLNILYMIRRIGFLKLSSAMSL